MYTGGPAVYKKPIAGHMFHADKCPTYKVIPVQFGVFFARKSFAGHLSGFYVVGGIGIPARR